MNSPTVMVYLWKSKTGLGYLDKALKHIIGITWESAAIPSILMIISVILYHCKAVSARCHLRYLLATADLVASTRSRWSDAFPCHSSS